MRTFSLHGLLCVLVLTSSNGYCDKERQIPITDRLAEYDAVVVARIAKSGVTEIAPELFVAWFDLNISECVLGPAFDKDKTLRVSVGRYSNKAAAKLSADVPKDLSPRTGIWLLHRIRCGDIEYHSSAPILHKENELEEVLTDYRKHAAANDARDAKMGLRMRLKVDPSMVYACGFFMATTTVDAKNPKALQDFFSNHSVHFKWAETRNGLGRAPTVAGQRVEMAGATAVVQTLLYLQNADFLTSNQHSLRACAWRHHQGYTAGCSPWVEVTFQTNPLPIETQEAQAKLIAMDRQRMTLFSIPPVAAENFAAVKPEFLGLPENSPLRVLFEIGGALNTALPSSTQERIDTLARHSGDERMGTAAVCLEALVELTEKAGQTEASARWRENLKTRTVRSDQK